MPVMAKKRRKKPAPAEGSWPWALKKVREERSDITQAEAARLAGVALRTWISWENSHRVPSGPSAKLLHIMFPELARLLTKS